MRVLSLRGYLRDVTVVVAELPTGTLLLQVVEVVSVVDRVVVVVVLVVETALRAFRSRVGLSRMGSAFSWSVVISAALRRLPLPRGEGSMTSLPGGSRLWVK